MNGVSIAYAFLAGILPSLLWLFFWLREDNLCPEPRLAIALTFLLGMLSVVLAIYGEGVAAFFVKSQNEQYIVWAAIEEICKALAVLIIALFSKQIDEPIDCMIYFITASLGFAAVENSLFILGSFASAVPSNTVQAFTILGSFHLEISNKLSASIIDVWGFRFIGATLVHTVSSALIGFCIGLVFYHRSFFIKTIFAFVGLGGATAIHSAFNIYISSVPPQDILNGFAWIWCAVIIIMILFEEIKAVHNPLSPVVDS